MVHLIRRGFGRLAVQVALGLLLVVAVVGFFVFDQLDDVMSENETERIRAELARARDRFSVQLSIYEHFALIGTVFAASSESVRDAALDDPEAALAAALDSWELAAVAIGGEARFSLFDTNGLLIAGGEESSREAPSPVLHVLQAGEPKSGIYLDPEFGAVMSAVAPVLSSDGVPAGALEIAFRLGGGDILSTYMGTLGMDFAFVIDGQTPLASSQELSEITRWPALDASGSGLVVDSEGRSYLASRQPALGHHGEPVGDFYLLVAENVVSAGIAGARQDLMLVIVAGTLLVTMLTFGVAWATTRPVRGLVESARRLQNNQLDEPVRVGGRGEIRSLATAMEDMRVAIRQSRDSLLTANRELSSRVDLSASSLADATNGLVTLHQVLARLEEARSGDLSGVTTALAELDWVDGVVIALRGRDGRLAAVASNHLAPGATVDLIDVVRLRLQRQADMESWHVPVTMEDPATSRLASRRIGGFAVEVMTTSDGVAGFVAVTAVNQLSLSPSRQTILRAIGREVALNLQRRALEEEVAENRRISEAVLREMSDGVLVLNHRGICRICNPAAARMLGYEASEIVGREAARYLPLDASDLEMMRGLTTEHPDVATPPVVTTYRNIRMAVTASLFPDPDATADGMILLLRDLSAEAEVERVRRDFVSIVGHELRTPLTLIRTSSELLGDGGAGDLNETQQRLVDLLQHNADRMSRLINDLVDVSALDPGRLEIHPSLVDISDIAYEVAEGLQPQASARRQQLSVRARTGLTAWADQNRIRQVLSNLVTNAIKYTPDGGSILIEVTEQPGAVQVAVTDTGIGITEDEQAMLFERFYRAPRGRRMSAGAGLGLSIARALVELHGGQMSLASDGETGSTFTFTLPREPIGSSEPPTDTVEVSSTSRA